MILLKIWEAQAEPASFYVVFTDNFCVFCIDVLTVFRQKLALQVPKAHSDPPKGGPEWFFDGDAEHCRRE